MRKALAAVIICCGAFSAFAATGTIQPLKVKTGLWQMAQKITWTGLPTQTAAALTNGMTTQYQSCVKQTDLVQNPWANGSGQKCSWTVLNSNGIDMEVQGTCTSNSGISMQMHGTIHVVDSENGTGSVDVALAGNGMNAKGHANYTGKWIGAICPADSN